MFDDFDEDLMDEADAAPVAAETGTLPPPRENLELKGHEGVEAQLVQLIEQGKLPHAMIFAGQEGIGKATLAFRLARYLLSPKEEEAPTMGLFGEAPAPKTAANMQIAADDPVFRRVASGGHPDLMVVERPYDDKKDKRKNAVDIDSVRKVSPFMRMTASSDKGWRVVIIDDADTMTRQAQNAILKILEEPPQRAVLILVTHRPGALIPTIRSRCRMVPFQAPPQEVFAALLQRTGVREQDAKTLYTLTGGSIGRAVRMAEQEGLETLSKLIVLLSAWPKWDWPAIHTLAENMGRQEDQYDMADDLLRWIVDSMVRAKAGAPLPAQLDGLRDMLDHTSLAAWIEIRENLTAHLDRIGYANLDRRQGIIGTFTILGSASPN